MRSLRLLLTFATLFASALVFANTDADAESSKIDDQALEQRIEELKEPLYNPFVERYVLDELKQLRVEMANLKVELTEKVVDRHAQSIDRGVTYATDTITYFFYLIAGVSSLLVLVGWTSVRDMKERMNKIADEEVGKLIDTYEQRLEAIERQLTQKTRHIDANREEIERTQELHALWLRAAQETQSANKIAIYDFILEIDTDNCEALTYKADEVLEQGEVQWAINLCQQALAIDPDNAHAFFQLACAKTMLGNHDQAIHYLQETLSRSQTYRESILEDPALLPLQELPEFIALIKNPRG